MADNISGFQGAVAGLSLTDVIQLKCHHKYTGCITVIYGNNEGVIYFADGEIIHAVQDNETGEEAIYQIIKWPGGSFNIHPEITSRQSLEWFDRGNYPHCPLIHHGGQG